MNVMVWEGAERSGNKDQVELALKTLSIKDIVAKLLSDAAKTIKHVARIQWTRQMMEREIVLLLQNVLLIFTDFAASLDFKARETLNCSVDRHGVLDNYVVISSRRHVIVNEQTGERAALNDCDLFQFVGESLEIGKNATFDKITQIKRKELLMTWEIVLDEVTKYTDNFPPQYKFKENFVLISSKIKLKSGRR
jgi:hypothetical protein